MKKIIFVISLFSLIGLASEDDFISFLSRKLESYNKEHQLVQVQLVFNQDTYVHGDTVFFRAFVLNENFLSIKERKVLTLEITNAEGQMMRVINFRISEGKAANQIVLPSEIKPGAYRFSVYPLSYSDKEVPLLFTKELVIVTKNKIQKPDPTALVLFHPEGGRLINEVENHVLVQSRLFCKEFLFNQNVHPARHFKF